jgi:PAS domain S-box-containing protein
LPHARFATSMGWLLFTYGVTVSIGWLVHWPEWTHVNPGDFATVFNAALCLTLGGIALFLPSLRIKSVERVRAALGLLIVAIGAASLAETVFSVDLGLDWPSLHRRLSDSNPFPGRMAPNTALALLLAGVPLALGGGIGADSTGGVLRRALPAAVVAIAVLGLASHTFHFDLAYNWYGFSRMAVPAGIAIVLFGLGLLFDSYAAADGQVRKASGEIRIYAFLGVAMSILVSVAFVSYGSINGLLDRIRWVEVPAGESELLLKTQRESQENSRSAGVIIVAGTAGGLCLLLYTFWILKRKNDQRTRSEQQLARANVFLDSLFENIPSMLFVKDARELKFLRFNKAGESLLGRSRDELIGKSDYDLFPEQDADIFRAREQAVLDSGRLIDIPEESVLTRHNGTRILHTMRIPILDAEGIPLYLLGISQDITERKHAEDRIKALNSTLRLQTEQLESANKELESFSYSVSHDLRAPLRAIDGFALMLLEDYGGRLDSEGRRYIDVIRGNATRMGHLIDDLLTLSRLGRVAITKSAVDMNQLVGEVVRESLEPRGDKPPRIDIGPLPAANADRVLIRQVWINLVSNAIKYSSKSPAPAIQVSGHQTAEECVYSVRDNGVGFSMEYYEKLFGVFQRLHRADEFSGTGVGLAIVQRLVTRHGGRVWAHAELNNGAEFSFALPTGEEDEQVRIG